LLARTHPSGVVFADLELGRHHASFDRPVPNGQHGSRGCREWLGLEPLAGDHRFDGQSIAATIEIIGAPVDIPPPDGP
jgi:hypothetical protein